MLSTICLGLKLVTRFPLILRGVSCPENQGATPDDSIWSIPQWLSDVLVSQAEMLIVNIASSRLGSSRT
jgi:hypothetical protein